MIPLHEAIMLGSTIIQRGHCSISRNDDARKRGSGCALDMAVVAVRGHGTWLEARDIWTWMPLESDVRIGSKFDNVVRHGDWTLEQFCDYVKSIEPTVTESIPAIADQPTISAWISR